MSICHLSKVAAKWIWRLVLKVGGEDTVSTVATPLRRLELEARRLFASESKLRVVAVAANDFDRVVRFWGNFVHSEYSRVSDEDIQWHLKFLMDESGKISCLLNIQGGMPARLESFKGELTSGLIAVVREMVGKFEEGVMI